MSIEKAIADLAVALNENTAALKAGGSTKPATVASTKGAPASKPDTSKATHTKAEITAILGEVKEKKGTPEAKRIITDVGGVAKMAEIPDDKLDAVYDEAKKVLGAGAAEDDM